MALYMKQRRNARRQILIEMSGSKCEKCGSQGKLEFNHKDRSSKLFVLSGAGLDTAWEKIIKEWEKTELICSDCHLDHTRMLYKTKQIKSWSKNSDPYIHGTMRCYQETKCRCEDCKRAKHLYRNKKIKYNEETQ
jgi:hypothetical protein